MFCTGTFERVLDDKQRVLLPKTVKKSLSQTESLFLTPGQNGCLELHSYDSLQSRSAEFTSSQSGHLKKAFSRLFYSQAECCQFDSQHRIRIPQRLLEWSSLTSKLIIVGVGGFWEFWDERHWQDYCSNHKSQFDEVANLLLSNGEHDNAESNPSSDQKIPTNPR